MMECLSFNQKSTIAREYESFVVERCPDSVEVEVVCRAGQLPGLISQPCENFIVNGQYSIHVRRVRNRVEIAGYDFTACFDRCIEAGPVRASLNVVREEEFPRVSVLGNFLRVLLAHQVLDRGGVLLHSAGVVHRGRAYLFSGRSNAGKTTLTRKAAAAGAPVLSDDINLVMPEQGEFRAHKVPFTGEFGCTVESMSGPGSVPLGGLALLEKAPALSATPVSPAEAVAGLLVGCPFVNDDPEEFPTLMDVLTGLVARTPVVRLGVALDDPFEAVMETMTRQCGHE